MLTGIKAKLTGLALVCAVLPCILISALAVVFTRATLQDAVRTELSELVASNTASLGDQIERADNNLSTWSSLHTLQDVLIDDQEGLISAELTQLQERYPLFSGLFVINPAGLVVAASEPGALGVSLKHEAYIAKGLAGQHHHGAVMEQPLTGRPGILLSFPIFASYDPQTVVGVVLGVLDWSRMEAALQAIPIWGAQQDADHRLLLTDTAGATLFGAAVEGWAPPPEDGVQEIRAEDGSYLAASKVDEDNGWVLHAMISERVAYARANALGELIAAVSSGILLTAGAIGAAASGRLIVRPVQAVTSAMNRVAAGETNVDLTAGESRRDEIGQMLQAIGVFRSNLERDKQAIEQREQSMRLQNVRFNAALNNMSQGLAMFDAEARLTVANPQFAALYRLDASPGASLRELLDQLIGLGLCPAGIADQYFATARQMAAQARAWEESFELADGRIIAIAHQPMADGGWVSTHADITEKRRAEAQIAHMAQHDALTGLPNRVLFRATVEAALQKKEGQAQLAVFCLDLDRFKAVNDALGHPVGDALLREVALRLRTCLDEGATVARLGGDEFAIVKNVVAPVAAADLARHVIQTLSEPYDLDGHHVVIGATVGLAFAPTDGLDPDTLLKHADLALYRGKSEGGGTYRLFEAEMDRLMLARRNMEMDLRQALARSEFEIHYQPLVNVTSEHIVGFEALLRWHHPERGLVSPAEFIPIAEETSLIVPIGEWVLRQACKDATAWPADVTVSVNLSPVQFRTTGLVQAVFSALANSQLSPTRLDLEITEAVLLDENEATLATLRQLQELGVRISMDDFGTGYSSLSYLQKFPFNKIKIDQSFVRNLGQREEALAIIRAVTGMGRSLGITTTAEGVETAEQLQKLRTEGCTEIQGYFVSRPQPLAAATELLNARGRLRAAS